MTYENEEKKKRNAYRRSYEIEEHNVKYQKSETKMEQRILLPAGNGNALMKKELRRMVPQHVHFLQQT